MAKKTVIIEPTNTHAVWKVLPGGTYGSDLSPYSIRIGYEANYRHSFGSYEWTFTSNWKTGSGIPGTITVESAYLEFYYHMADNPYFMPQFTIVRTVGAPSAEATDQDAWNSISSGTIIATPTTVRGDNKNLIRVTIDDATALAAAINSPGDYSMGLRREDSTRDTRIEVGGNNLLSGIGTGWIDASVSGVKGPPRLILTVSYSDETHITQELRYTTADPTSAQNTPSNSIGGYVAPNEVFTTAQIGDFVSSTDTSITIGSGSSLPSSTGIAQIGPEIVSYAGIDTNNRQLTGVTRGVAPLSGVFPSEVDRYSEYIRYLTVTDLFDKKPSEDLEQYRCVAVLHTSSTSLQNTIVALTQNSSADVQIDIGIEVPAFDATTGSASAAIDAGDLTFDSVSDSVRSKETGYYDGGHIVIDPSGTAFEAIIESYDDDGATATFILDRAMPAFGVAPGFRINPAPAQTVANERTRPNNNSGRFLGFLAEGGENSIGYDSIRESGSTLEQYDAIYLWIKRTLVQNKKSTHDTGGIVLISGDVPGGGSANKNRGWWKFDQTLDDEIATADFIPSAGTIPDYQSFRQFDLTRNQIITKYGLMLEDDATYNASISGSFYSSSIYSLALGMWYYNPTALGFVRHAVTRDTTPRIIPIVAKANTTVTSGEESVTAGQGEWIVSEVGYSKTQNAIQLAVCGANNDPTDIYVSAPYTPGLVHVFISVVYSSTSNYARIDINGEFGEQHTTLVDIQTPGATVAPIRLNGTGFGYTAHKASISSRYISDLLLLNNGTTNSDQTVKMARFGPTAITTLDNENDRVIFLGIGYDQPETVTTTQIYSEGGHVFVTRSNGEILEGHKPIWANDFTFGSPSSVNRLTASMTGLQPEWTPAGLKLQGTTIRI